MSILFKKTSGLASVTSKKKVFGCGWIVKLTWPALGLAAGDPGNLQILIMMKTVYRLMQTWAVNGMTIIVIGANITYVNKKCECLSLS